MEQETQLIQKLRKPKTRDKAFSQLIDLYQERLYWHVRKIVISHDNANDVLQNTFVRVYQGIQKFKGNSSLHTWMFRIAYNESIRFLEKHNRKRAYSLDDMQNSYLNTLAQDPYFDGGELQTRLHTVVAALSEKQQLVFRMKYFDDLSFREISEILGTNENTLKSTYYSAVTIIEKKIILASKL